MLKYHWEREEEKTLVAPMKGTLSIDVVKRTRKSPLQGPKRVKEVTLDMAKNMEAAVKHSFPEANLVTDRFHVVKLVLDVLQHLRFKLRWNELDIENQANQQARENEE